MPRWAADRGSRGRTSVTLHIHIYSLHSPFCMDSFLAEEKKEMSIKQTSDPTLVGWTLARIKTNRMDGVETSKADVTSDGEQLIANTECVWNIDLVCVEREASPSTLSSVLKYKWKNNTFTLRSLWEQRISWNTHRLWFIFRTQQQQEKRDWYHHLTSSLWIMLCMPAESKAVSAFSKPV